MRLRHMIPAALLVAISTSLLAAASAHANSGIDAASASATSTPAASTSVVTTSSVASTSASKPADTSTSSTPKPADTSTTSTPKPTTSTTTTAPSTTSSTTTTATAAPCTGSSSDSSGGPVCQEGETPITQIPETPKVTPHPQTPEVPEASGTTPQGGGDLPFTGPGDVLLAIVLALLAATGGIVLLAGATGREQIESLSRRSMASPSGFKLQYREVLRDLTD